MLDVLAGGVIAFSFFTVAPMPFLAWTPKRMAYMPYFMPVVGAFIGSLSFGLYHGLMGLCLEPFFAAVLMVLFYLWITGGIHFDGLMDAADAFFSRRDIPRKLEIMTDSRVGAFAVMAAISVLLYKIGVFLQLMTKGFPVEFLVIIPVLSRCLQGGALRLFPYAKEEGLGNMYGASKGKAHGIYFILIYAGVSLGLFFWRGNGKEMMIPLTGALFFIYYYHFCKKHFGGITGDLLGAFLELTECIFWFALVFM